jgi:hypothetical protein
MEGIMAFSKDEIRFICLNPTGNTIINGKTLKNAFLIYRMLQSMYEIGQTPDEQNSRVTRHSNGVGFNGVDAPFLSDVAIKSAEFFRANPLRTPLTPGQAKHVGLALKKYAGQLRDIALSKQLGRPERDVQILGVQQVLPIQPVKTRASSVKRTTGSISTNPVLCVINGKSDLPSLQSASVSG